LSLLGGIKQAAINWEEVKKNQSGNLKSATPKRVRIHPHIAKSTPSCDRRIKMEQNKQKQSQSKKADIQQHSLFDRIKGNIAG